MAGTPYQTIYDAFLAKVQEDDWAWSDDFDSMTADWKSILDSALPYFKFPRVTLTLDDDEEEFVNTLGAAEIQILATYMKVEWLNRTILTWENVKPFYAEADFSQANLLDKLIKLSELTEKRADKLQHLYYRSINGAPFDYSALSGG